MNQFNIYKNNNPKSSKNAPLLIDLQSEPMHLLATRIVAPLRLEKKYSDLELSRIHLRKEITDAVDLLFTGF